MKITIKHLLALLCVTCSSWAYTAQPAQMTPLAFSSLMTDIASRNNTVIAVGELGHILYSKDQGENWKQANVPVDTLLTAISMLDENTAWAVGHDGIVIKTEDGGENWTLLYRTLDHSEDEFVDPLLDVTFWNSNQGIAVGAFGQYYTSNDGGRSWDIHSENLPNEDELHLNSVLRTSDGQLFIASEYGNLFYSMDDGSSWQLITLPVEATFFSLAYQPDVKKIIIVGIAGNAFSFSIETSQVEELPIRVEQSLYAAHYANQQLHLVGAKGIWQADQYLQIDNERMDFHAITFATLDKAVIATSSGVKIASTKIKLQEGNK